MLVWDFYKGKLNAVQNGVKYSIGKEVWAKDFWSDKLLSSMYVKNNNTRNSIKYARTQKILFPWKCH